MGPLWLVCANAGALAQGLSGTTGPHRDTKKPASHGCNYLLLRAANPSCVPTARPSESQPPSGSVAFQLLRHFVCCQPAISSGGEKAACARGRTAEPSRVNDLGHAEELLPSRRSVALCRGSPYPHAPPS